MLLIALWRNYWDTKKIAIIDTTSEEFVRALTTLRRGVAAAQPIAVGSLHMLPRFLASMNPASDEADQLAWAFDFLDLDRGESDPATFFRRAPPSWATIRDGFDARTSKTC